MTGCRSIPPPAFPARGFTLPELMAVLTIAALFIGMAVPNFQRFLAIQRVNSASAAFLQAINLTRSTAIMRGVRTNLAPRNGKDWRSGWRIFVKHDNNTDSDFQAGDILITEHASLPDSLAITTTVRAAIIAYQSTGTNTAGSWLFEEAEQQRLIAVNLIGRVRSCRPGVDPGCSLPPGLTRSASPAK